MVTNIQNTYSLSNNDKLTIPRRARIRIGANGADVTLKSTILTAGTTKGNDTNASIPSVSNVFYTIDTVTDGEQITTATAFGAGTIIQVTGGAAEIELLNEV